MLLIPQQWFNRWNNNSIMNVVFNKAGLHFVGTARWSQSQKKIGIPQSFIIRHYIQTWWHRQNERKC